MESVFGNIRHAPADGPLAMGEDFRPAVLLDAYRHGVFPWPDGSGSVYWWSPDPRMVFAAGTVHRSRTLRRTMRSGRFSTTRDTAFEQVMEACGERPGEGTWITPAMQDAYAQLHRLGHAHSVEVWDDDGALVGGIYGIAVGGVFTGESMFHRVADASKVALATLDAHLAATGFVLLDAQLHTDHLESMGGGLISRDRFLDVLERVRDEAIEF